MRQSIIGNTLKSENCPYDDLNPSQALGVVRRLGGTFDSYGVRTTRVLPLVASTVADYHFYLQ